MPPNSPPPPQPGANNLLVEDFMLKTVYSINADMTIRDATNELLKHAISGAPVIDGTKRVLTVVSEGDLLRLTAAMGLEKTIFQCMLKLTKADKLITLKLDDTFAEAYRKFMTHKVHRLIVIDEKGRLEGIVSRSTILKILVDPNNQLPPQKTP